jgi:hypothetical protein
VFLQRHSGVAEHTVRAVASDDDASQTPMDAAPKKRLEDGMTWIDNQFEEDLEPPLGQDRDEAEEGEAELAGCRVTRTSTRSRRRKTAARNQ